MDQAERLRQARAAADREPRHAWNNSFLRTEHTPTTSRASMPAETAVVCSKAIHHHDEEDPERWDGQS